MSTGSHPGALRDGDEERFVALVDRWYGATVRLARALAPDESTARRAARGAWLRTIDRLPLREDAVPMHVELLRETVEGVVAELEAGEGEPGVDPESFEPDDHRWGGWWREDRAPPTTWPAQPSGEAISRALAELAPAAAAVVLLRDVEDMPPEEVEAALGFAEEAQRALLHEGRGAIRRILLGEA